MNQKTRFAALIMVLIEIVSVFTIITIKQHKLNDQSSTDTVEASRETDITSGIFDTSDEITLEDKPIESSFSTSQTTHANYATLIEPTETEEPAADTTEYPTEYPTEEPAIQQQPTYNIKYTTKEFDEYLYHVMDLFGIYVDPAYIYATIFRESLFRATIESSAGAVGYMQVMPSTRDCIYPMLINEYQGFEGLSSNLADPYANITYGLYLCHRIASRDFDEDYVTMDNLSKVLTCYNRGTSGGKSYFNKYGTWESDYVKRIYTTAQQIIENGGL